METGAKIQELAHMRHILFAELLPDQQLDILGALKCPDPVQLAGGAAGESATLLLLYQPVLEARQFAAVVGLKDGLHVDQRHEDIPRLLILQQQIPVQQPHPPYPAKEVMATEANHTSSTA